MRKTFGKIRIPSFLLAVTMLCSMLSAALPSVSAAATPEMSNISISDDTGYYVKDGSLYAYSVSSGQSTAVEGMTELDAAYVLYDGTTLYTAGANTVVKAYHTADWSPKWTYDNQEAFKFTVMSFFPETKYCQPNAEMALDGRTLYIYTYAQGGWASMGTEVWKAAVVALDTADGKEKAPVSVQDVNGRDVPKSLTYKLNGSILFAGSTVATVHAGTDKVTYEAGLFESGAAYEESIAGVVGLDRGTVHYADFPISDSPETTDMRLTPAGSGSVMERVDNVPVVFSLKDGTIVYDIFTGLDLVTRETNIKADGLSGLTVAGKDIYVLNSDGEVVKFTPDFTGVTTHQALTEAAKSLDKRIKAVVRELPTFNDQPNIDGSSLALEAEINAIHAAYTAMDETERRGVFEIEWLNKLKNKTDELRARLDGLNAAVNALPSAENLKKSDAKAVKDARDTYNGLKDFDKTLVDKKLFVLLEKVAAFDVVDLIDALPTLEDIKTTDLAAVQAARSAYKAVADKWKSEVRNIAGLEALEKRLNELLKGIGEGSYWSSYGKDHNNSAAVDSKLPTSLADMDILFYGQEEELSANEPIIVGDRMYTARGAKLFCFDLNGKRIATVDTYTSSDFFSRLAYGDGKIFVTISGRVQAFDAETLNPLWLTPKTDLQMQSPITYNDGYIYFGGTNGGGGGSGATDGAYFCVSTEDENPGDQFETKAYTWESRTGGYYWGGGIVVGDKIYFAGDNGILYVHHLTQSIVYDSYALGGKVRSVPVYDYTTNRLMAATVDNHTLYAIEINKDGSLNKETIIKTDEISGSMGGFSTYNGRVYLPSGGMLSSGPLVVLALDENAGRFTKAYEIPEIKSQSLPLITTAYATRENGYKVYVYAVDYETGVAFCFEDSQAQTAYKKVFQIDNKAMIGGKEHKTTTYNSGGFRADQNGNLYFIGGSSWGFPDGGSSTSYSLTVFGNKKAAFTAEDVKNAVALLPDDITYKDKQTVMAVKARYDALVSRSSVSNADKLMNAVEEIERLTRELLAQVKEHIEKISVPVVLADEKAIEEAGRLYGGLLENDKALVTGRDTLKAALAALYELKASVAGLMEKIEQLPARDEITLEHTALVNELWTAYEALSDSDKEKVTNSGRLLEAKDKLKELNDKLLVNDFIAEIDALAHPDKVTLADEEIVKNLYTRYGDYHDAAKAMITNAQKLKDLYARITAYRAAVNEIDSLIWNELDPLNITLRDRALVESLAEKYAALRKEEQTYVRYYSDVEDARDIIASLEKGIIPKQVFENIADMDKNYTAEGDGYAITFNGMSITRPADFDYGVSMNPPAGADLEKLLKNGAVFGFDETGSFPGKAVISLEVALRDGPCTLYRFDAANNVMVKVQTAEVKAGRAVFTADKGGVYAIAEGLAAVENTDMPQTGDTGASAAAVALSLSGLLALAGAAVRKKKHAV